MIFLDSNAAIDLLNVAPGPAQDWAARHYERLTGIEPFASNLIVIAEVAFGLGEPQTLLRDLARLEIEVLDLSIEAAFRASEAFREYRRRGGPRLSILPDFLIAAHAETLGAQLMTRDRRLASYFPNLSFLTPESEHG